MHKYNSLAEEELDKGANRDQDLVAQLQTQAQNLRAEIDLQTSGEVQHHGSVLCCQAPLASASGCRYSAAYSCDHNQGCMLASSHSVHLRRHSCLQCFVTANTCNCWAACRGQGHCGSHVLDETCGLGVQGLTVVKSTGEVLLKGQPPAASTSAVCKLDKACYLVRGETSVTDRRWVLDMQCTQAALSWVRSHTLYAGQTLNSLTCWCACGSAAQHSQHYSAVKGTTADLLLSDEALDKVYHSIFLVLDQHEDCVGGGFYYAPGKAVTADHNLLPEQR